MACRSSAGHAVRLILTLLLMVVSAPVTAQEPLADPVVLALNILSDTHARPATGLVVSPSGQVLLPADFVGRGDDIVLLDGGTSLDRNAIATRTEARSAQAGWAVVAADGLQRAHFRLSATGPAEGERVTFMAFPTAEELAAGSPPLRETVNIVLLESGPAISTNTPLPNLNGALVNRCGLLAGAVITDGETSMQRDGDPRVTWSPALKDALSALGVNADTGSCERAPAVAQTSPVPEQDSGEGPQILDPANLRPAEPDLDIDDPESGNFPAQAADHRSANQTAPEETPDGADSPVARLAAEETAQDDTPVPEHSPAPTRQDSGNDWLLAVILAAAAGWWLGRVSRKPLAHATSVEAPESDAITPYEAPRVAAAVNLMVRIRPPNGSEDTVALTLHGEQSTVLVGSGHADLVISDASVDRMHGRLCLIDGALVYSDMGSVNGSWVNGVSCLEGEHFILGPDDRLMLGQVGLKLRPAQSDTQPS